MTNKLKPCPFCGGEAEIIKIGNQFKIRCKKWACGASNIKFDSLNMAIKTWNTRTPNWISVEDALPEQTSRHYICISTCDDCVTFTKQDVLLWVKRINCFSVTDGYTVTHWMPLPQMPEVKHG